MSALSEHYFIIFYYFLTKHASVQAELNETTKLFVDDKEDFGAMSNLRDTL